MATEEEITEAKKSILAYLKQDLQRTNFTDDQLSYLSALVESAITEIEREGVTLDLTVEDQQLTVSSYAAYLYRFRETPDVKMPNMLRYRLNQLQFSSDRDGTES